MKFYESDLEQATLDLLVQAGWQAVYAGDLSRSPNECLLKDKLCDFLQQRYANEQLSDNEIAKIIAQLEHITATPLYEGNKSVFYLLNQGITFQRDNANLPAVHIRLVDFECVDNNSFVAVNQFEVAGEHHRIPDILLFINGIPICIMELKNPTDENATVFDAWQQIHIRYKRDIPKLLKYTCLSVISDGVNNLLGSVFTPYEFYYTWNKVDNKTIAKQGVDTLNAVIFGALSPVRIVAILQNFIYYPDKSDNETVIVARYPQFFATNAMFNNIKAHLRPHSDGKGGTYFGATGCGKTYTMLYLTRMLIQQDPATFKNPTIVIITDREDLDNQASKIFTNAKQFLGEEEVVSIDSRQDLADKLKAKPSGGVYLTTIQKFAEYVGLLSDRTNIICISDEAHRTQTGVTGTLDIDETGVNVKYGFAKYLRDGFPNATYVGFTGTPIDETLAVFGQVVDKYTMKQASDDGITVRIAYEPRLARVLLSEEKVKQIQAYYDECANLGANEHQIEQSKKQMSQMRQILAHPERLALLAKDMVEHYETLCAENPAIVKKAMIVCADRAIAFDLLQHILAIRPDWGIAKQSDESFRLPENELAKLSPIAKINLVATRNDNDPNDLYHACGTKEYRKELDRQFKNEHSNFKIAIVVDMWITGFDVPSLAVMYIDKPLQKHTLIQTISRVNRNFAGKTQGIVVDYIGIKNAMLEAVKLYGDNEDTPVDEIGATLAILRNHLALLDNLLYGFDSQNFYHGTPLARLHCLNLAVEWVQQKKDKEVRFMALAKRLKSAYEICLPTGELSDDEQTKSQFFIAIRAMIYKQETGGDVPDTEQMNAVVQKMVQEAMTSTSIESVIDDKGRQALFDEEFEKQLGEIDLPISKFHALLNLLKQAIRDYGKTNKIKSIAFNERMKQVVERYNSRDKLAFVNEVVGDFINSLSSEIIGLLKELHDDKRSFEKLGIGFEEKAFYDILIYVRDEHQFDYADDKCVILAQKIKALIDDKLKFGNWVLREDIKHELNMQLTILLYENGYPPEWNQEIFEKVLEQAEHFKQHQ